MKEPIVMQIREIIADYTDRPVESVLVSSTIQSLGLDSLDIVELSITLEDRFSAAIPIEVLESWKKVSDVVLYMEQLRKDSETNSADCT